MDFSISYLGTMTTGFSRCQKVVHEKYVGSSPPPPPFFFFFNCIKDSTISRVISKINWKRVHIGIFTGKTRLASVFKTG